MKRTFPLHLHISALIVVLLIVVSGTIAGIGYRLARDLGEAHAAELTARIAATTQAEVNHLLAPAATTVKLIVHQDLVAARSLTARLAHLAFLRQTLDSAEALASVYVGYANGDFILLRAVRNAADRDAFQAPADCRYIVQSIERAVAPVRGRYLYFDATLKLLRSEDRPTYPADYDPRQRGWYALALAADGLAVAPPYVFFSNRKVGTTLALRAPHGTAVAGVDLTLESLSRIVAAQKVTPGTQIALTTPDGRVLAHEMQKQLVRQEGDAEPQPVLATLAEMGVPALAAALPRVKDFSGREALKLRLRAADRDWRLSIAPLAHGGGTHMLIVTAIPEDELMAGARELMQTSLLAAALLLLIALPLTWGMARAIAGPMRALAGAAEAIRHFEFDRPIATTSPVSEVNDLATTMDGMKHTIRRFLDINQAVAAETDFAALLPRLLTETLAAAEARGGILYLADIDGLIPMAALRADGGELPGGGPGELLPVAVPETGDVREKRAAAGPLLGGALDVRRPRAAVLQAEDVAALGLDAVIAGNPASRHAIAIPLVNRRDQLVGAMLLLADRPTDSALLSFIEALSGSAAVTLESRELIKAQKDLFEAMIQLIAGAIDAKSAYTGGHCARVPELTKMLARAACAQTEGPFADFQLRDEDWEAVHVAAWLHDCGKVTTPEYVVDKATKLETLYDRLHEVRMRFEVLKRDARIEALEARLAGVPENAAQTALAARLARIDDDFRFVAICNEGGEFMAPEKLERLNAIAGQTWLRTLDDRIGISHEEKQRKERAPAPDLPVLEPLLADKPEHRFERRPQDRMPANNKWGFRMTVPELLYNKGELYNLGIARGTLAEEERYKINEHIVQTIVMLAALPFPKHLRQVPEIAGGHHEKMDGSGYPKRLDRDAMSPVARMMAIADIFEALTAVDRPYKQGKTLAEAIKIMSFMKRDRHIDPELFDLFLRSGTHLEYARRFMQPEQIDAVDIAPYLTPTA